MVQEFTDIEAYGDIPMNVSSLRLYNKANIFLGLVEYELNNLLGASHLVDYMSVHIRFDLERYLLNIILGVPKRYRRLINNRTKVFGLIFRISFILHKSYPNLDFEIKIAKIR